MKRGKSCQVEIDIVDNTDHDIVFRGQTSLGRLQLVQSVTSVEVKLKDSEEPMKETRKGDQKTRLEDH